MTSPIAPLALIKPLRRGSELRIRLNVKTFSGQPQDTTGATFTANIRTGEAKDSTVIAVLTKTIVSDPAGIVDFSRTPTETLALVGGLDYWVSIWVNGTFTGGIDRLELHGKLPLIG